MSAEVPTSIEDASPMLSQEHAKSVIGVRAPEDETLTEVVVVDNNLKPYSEYICIHTLWFIPCI